MIRRFFNRILEKRGYSLIMALVTITLLVLLGLAVVTISMGTLKSNEADITTNQSYYAAEAGVNSALDQLKLEVSRYYTSMKGASSTDYPGMYTNFAANIISNITNAQSGFSDPPITGGSTKTTFAIESFDSQANVYCFLATSTSTMADGTKYKVEGRLKVKRVDISAKSWYNYQGALVVGKTLTVNCGSGITVNGDAALGGLVHQNSWDVTINGKTNIDPNVYQSINDVLNYPSFSDPVISNPKYYFTANKTIDNNYSWANPVTVDTAENVNLVITNTIIMPDGIIRARGDLSMNTGVNIYSDLYCKNFSNTNSEIYGNIYAHGNVTKSGGKIFGDIYCDGNVTLNGIGVYGSIICGGNITIQGRNVNGRQFVCRRYYQPVGP